MFACLLEIDVLKRHIKPTVGRVGLPGQPIQVPNPRTTLCLATADRGSISYDILYQCGSESYSGYFGAAQSTAPMFENVVPEALPEAEKEYNEYVPLRRRMSSPMCLLTSYTSIPIPVDPYLEGVEDTACPEVPEAPETPETPEVPDTPNPNLNDDARPHSVNEFYSDDGDITLRSKDGKLIKTHVHMLKTAFTLFKGNFAWHRVRDAQIDMDQDGATLGVLIKLLYPIDTKPPSLSKERLISVLQATKDLGMTSVLARAELSARIEAERNPLRAWALASAFGFPEARRNAVERYLKTDSYLLSDAPSELRFVDGSKVFNLLSAKEGALLAARNALSQISWHCGHCEDGPVQAMTPYSRTPSPEPTPIDPAATPYLSLHLDVKPDPDVRPKWRGDFLSRTAGVNPFVPDVTSETYFELCATRSSCRGCKNSFRVAASREARNRLRTNLKRILTSALDEVAPVRARQHAFLDSYSMHRAAVRTSMEVTRNPTSINVLQDRLFFNVVVYSHLVVMVVS